MMTLTAAWSRFIILFLSMSVVRGQYVWKVTYSHPSLQICALAGSTVDIRCTYIYPRRVNGEENKLSKVFWFPEKEGYNIDIEKSSNYSGQVKNICKGDTCTLRISDLRESDADKYFFRLITSKNRYFGQPGVSLSITGLEVVMQRQPSGLRFKCLSRCPDHVSFIWFKNGQKIRHQMSKFYSPGHLQSDRYSCAVQGYEKSPSPPVYTPGLPFVSMNPSAEIMEGSSLILTCSSDANPAAKYTWYKKNENPDLQPLGEGPQIVLSSVRPSDSGNYYCEAENDLGKTASESVSVDVKSAVSEEGTPLIVVGITAVALLVILSLSVFLWMRKKRASRGSPEVEDRPNHTEQPDQRQPEEQNNLQYATINFSQNQASLYSNITPARPIRYMEQQDVSEYAVVKYDGNSSTTRTRGQDTGEDPAALYSTVGKTR